MRRVIIIETIKVNDSTYQYKGVESGLVLFNKSINDTSDGIVEYIGAIHGLMLIKKNMWNGEVRVKTPYIKECISNKKYPHKSSDEKTDSLLSKCTMWVLEQKKILDIYLINPEDEKKVKDVSERFKQRKTWYNE